MQQHHIVDFRPLHGCWLCDKKQWLVFYLPPQKYCFFCFVLFLRKTENVNPINYKHTSTLKKKKNETKQNKTYTCKKIPYYLFIFRRYWVKARRRAENKNAKKRYTSIPKNSSSGVSTRRRGPEAEKLLAAIKPKTRTKKHAFKKKNEEGGGRGGEGAKIKKKRYVAVV